MPRKQCTIRECRLYRQTEVPYSGNTKADIVFVGESPGRTELKRGKPFVGEAGKMAKRNIAEAGLDWKKLFIMNSARCLLDTKSLSQSEETAILNHCRTHFNQAMAFVKPKLIIASGNIAMRQTVKQSGITKHRGQWVWSEEFNAWVMPTYHPAYILRNRSLEAIFREDLRAVKRAADNGGQPFVDVQGETDYREVQSIKGLFTKQELKAGVGFDTEDQGLDWMDPNFVLISYSVSATPGKGYSITLFEEATAGDYDFRILWPRPEEGKKKKVLTPVYIKRAENFDQKVAELKALLESPSVKLYMMNGNFDVHCLEWLWNHLDMGPLVVRNYSIDIQAAAHLVDENIFKMASLDMLQQFFTDEPGDYNTEFNQEHDKSDMLAIPLDARSEYAGKDADITCRAAKTLRSWLLEPGREDLARYMVKFVMPTLQTLATMERNGAYFDAGRLSEVKREIGAIRDENQSKCEKLIPKKIKEMESHQKKGLKLTRFDLLRDLFFTEDGFRCPVLKRAKSKAPAFDKEVRTKLADMRIGKKAKKFLELYAEWQEANTMYTRYLNGLEKAVDPDGMIRSRFGIVTAVTGRVNSSDPNLMNIPKRGKLAPAVRRLIAAPPGYLLMKADESQSELRWAAMLADERAMMRVFQRGEDIHTNTAKGLVANTGKVWAELAQKEIEKYRRNAKPMNFGLLYGMQVYGFIKYAKIEYGITLTEAEAELWIETFFDTYPGLRSYHSRAIEFCREHGYVVSPIGRRRNLPEIRSNDQGLRHEAERQAINAPIQSVSSDTVLMAANEIAKLDLNPEEFKLSLFIHDELVFLVKESADLPFYGRILKDALENPPFERDYGYTLTVPLKSDVQVGTNLVDCEDLKL